jgi:charged multivesicular body protein 4
LTAELEELEQEVLDSQLLGADAPPVTAPNVPTSEPGMKFNESLISL